MVQRMLVAMGSKLLMPVTDSKVQLPARSAPTPTNR